MARKKRGNGEEEEVPTTTEPGMPFPAEALRATTFDPKTGEPVDSVPVDLEEYDEGTYYYQLGYPEEEFHLKTVEDDPRQNTHHLKSEHHYWEGTELQFKEQFSDEQHPSVEQQKAAKESRREQREERQREREKE
jgi:hypothetical protein